MDRSAEKAIGLLAEHGERLYGLLVRITLREDVADDLMQELFLKLSRAKGFADARDMLAYAIRVATNLAFDWRRTQKRLPRLPLVEKEMPVADVSVASDLVANEDMRRVLEAIDRLRPSQRCLIVMRYLQSQDYETIAHGLGRSPHQVRALCHKAIRNLRRLLEKQFVPRRESGDQSP